jgi:hypothetical protein
MTRPRDIDSVLEAWFLDGPSEMPDRLFEAVFDRVERVPQRRLARLKLRYAEMSSTARLIAAGAAAILVVGIGLAALGRGPDGKVGTSPSPSPSASSSASSAAGAPIPAELRHFYLGAFRENPKLPASQDRSILQFSDSTFTYNETYLRSTASAPAAGTVRLVAENVSGGCVVGDEGLYSWSLSPGGSKLTFSVVSDACDSRGATIAGDWQRSDCPNPDNLCLGNLEAGRYASQFIDPFIPPRGDWKARFGALTYDVPEGWANSEDFPSDYVLKPQGATDERGIHVWGDIVIVSEEDPCAETPASTVGRTAQAMTDWLATAPGVAATEPVAVSIGGLDGWRLDVSMDPSWTTACPFSQGRPLRGLFTGTPGGGFHWGLERETQMRLFILDLGDGRALVVETEAPTKADFDAIVDEATAIVESFNFPR